MQQGDFDNLNALHIEARTALENGVVPRQVGKRFAALSGLGFATRNTALYLETYIMFAVAARVKPARANSRMGRLKSIRAAAGQEILFNDFEAIIDRSLGNVKLTGHGYSTQSLGDADPRAMFRAIAELVMNLNRLGCSVFANSGTLLGLIRDQAPITYDDDIDLAVILDATDDVSAAREFDALFVRLQAAGFEGIDRVGAGTIIKLPKLNGFQVDLFPAYSAERGFCIYPYSFGELTQSDILPLKPCPVSGIPVPANPERVLEVNYGKTWITPNRRFVFPWKRQNKKFAVLRTELSQKNG